jgi:hypothetical protein
MNRIKRQNTKITAALCNPHELEKRQYKRARLLPKHLLAALEETDDPEVTIACIPETIKISFLVNHYKLFIQYVANHTQWDKQMVDMGTSIMQREARGRAQHEGERHRLVDFYIKTGIQVSVYVRGRRRLRRGGVRWERFRTFCGNFIIRHQRKTGIRLTSTLVHTDAVQSWEKADAVTRTSIWHQLTGTSSITTTPSPPQSPIQCAGQVLGSWDMLLKKNDRLSTGSYLYFGQKSLRYDNVCFKDCDLFLDLSSRVYDMYGPVSKHVGSLATLVVEYAQYDIFENSIVT